MTTDLSEVLPGGKTSDPLCGKIQEHLFPLNHSYSCLGYSREEGEKFCIIFCSVTKFYSYIGLLCAVVLVM